MSRDESRRYEAPDRMFEIEHAYRGYSPRRAARSVAMRARALRTTTTFVALLVGAIVFAVAYADGGYSLAARSTLAVALWWAILLGVALGVWPLERVPRGAIAVGAMLALFALWALASAAWAPSVEAAVHEFDRNALYLGVYVLAVVAVSRGRLPAWIAGLTFALTATALVALASRLFPGLFSDRELVTALPSSAARLSFPLGYWNGLGLFTAMAYPLLLHAALAGGRARRRLSLGVVPALGATIYLTSSRGAVVALGCGLVVFVAAEARRAEAVAALLIASAGTAAAIVALVPRNA